MRTNKLQLPEELPCVNRVARRVWPYAPIGSCQALVARRVRAPMQRLVASTSLARRRFANQYSNLRLTSLDHATHFLAKLQVMSPDNVHRLFCESGDRIGRFGWVHFKI